MLLEALAESVRTGEKEVFQRACRQLARLRRAEPYGADDLLTLLDALNDHCLRALAPQRPDSRWSMTLRDHVTMTVQFGIDEVLDVFDHRRLPPALQRPTAFRLPPTVDSRLPASEPG